MKTTYDWLKDFVEIKIPPALLADRLTMAGLEVTSLERRGGDFIFDFEITSNRPDLLSTVGIAQEIAAITSQKLKPLRVKDTKRRTQSAGQISIRIEDKNDCPLYTAKIIKGVKVGPAPAWMRKRLELIGCRSINNVVDITNYILFTWGQPLHAFDLDKVSSHTIVVRRGRSNEAIVTIDGEKRSLGADTLVIADKEQAIAIAGVMGGKDSEVAEGTRNLLLESAVFNPLIIRRARQKLGVQTDSSYRFERSIDFTSVEKASFEAAKLINEIAGGDCVSATSSPAAMARARTKGRTINLNVSKVSGVLGAEIKAQKIKEILGGLRFKVASKSNNNLTVGIPACRRDILLEIDLIEEIARIFGYEHIPVSLPPIKPQQLALASGGQRPLVSLIKNTLIGLGLNEVITYSLIDRDLLDDFNRPDLKFTQILNPLSKEQEILRPTIMPSLVRCVAHNLNQKQNYVAIFEVAKAFPALSPTTPEAKEELVLGIALCGEKSMLYETGRIKEKIGILHLKGVLGALFEKLGIKKYNFNLADNRGGSVHLEETRVGLIANLQKNILNNLGIKNKDVVAAEIFLEKISPFVNLKKHFSGLCPYPGILQDISLVIGENIRIKDILSTIKEKAGDLLRETKIVDYYKGAQIPSGCRGLTISCLYLSNLRTLTDAEIKPLHSSVCQALIDKFSAKIRQGN